jgi:hypothetical protein
MSEEIANADLMPEDVPGPDADWSAIGRFALTFDGYRACGSLETCKAVAERWADAYAERGALPDSLTALRTCLFYEQRRWRHYGRTPDPDAMAYIRALVDEIRRRAHPASQ